MTGPRRQHTRGLVTRVAALAVAVGAPVACGQEQDPYEVAPKIVGDWLRLASSGDAAACDLETDDFHRSLLEREELPARLTCEERVEVMAADWSATRMTSPDAEIGDAIWDPSGEAVVVVSGPERVLNVGLLDVDGEWLLDGFGE